MSFFDMKTKEQQDAEWYEGERKAKEKKTEAFNPPAIQCACGKPVGPESPQIDQCLSCFNRT